MLDLEQVDLASLCEALEDHSDSTQWWLDPSTGKVEPWSSDRWAIEDDEDPHPAERDWIPIEPLSSRGSYADLEEFTERVRDPRARDLLERAIAGRGAFRRFKDTLFDFPELREAWFKFHDARTERRALQWLADEGLVDEPAAERAMLQRPDPDLPELSGAFDAEEIARTAAEDLRRLYGDRLRRVLLFGSWARGDAHPESDIGLLVVLDRVDAPWEELERMDEILDGHSVENDTVVSALVVSEADLESRRMPAAIRANAEGRVVL